MAITMLSTFSLYKLLKYSRKQKKYKGTKAKATYHSGVATESVKESEARDLSERVSVF